MIEKISTFAMRSRDHVLNHEKYKEIFEPYAHAIGIDQKPDVPEWGDLAVKSKAREKVQEEIEAMKKKIKI